MEKKNVFPFLLIGMYLVFNWANIDKSIPEVEETLENVKTKDYIRFSSFLALFSGKDGPYIKDNSRIIVSLVIVATLATIFWLFAPPTLVQIVNIFSLSFVK